MNPAHTVSDLMSAPDHAHIFRQLKAGGVVCAGSRARTCDVEATRDREPHEFWNADKHIDADITRIEILRAGFRNLRTINRPAEIADRAVANQICIAEYE